MLYPSFKPRINKQQEFNDQLNDQLINYLQNIDDECDADTIWLAMLDKGNVLSQSTIYNRLKRLVKAGLVKKRAIGYRKHLYRAVPKA